MGKNIAFVLTANPEISVTVTDIAEQDIRAGIRVSCRQLVSTASSRNGSLNRGSAVTPLPRTCAAGPSARLNLWSSRLRGYGSQAGDLHEAEAVCSPEAIFCTNTSVMSPSEISVELNYRARFVGTHFWNPAHLIPLVEVVRSDATSDETAETVMTLLASVGKKPVLCKKDGPASSPTGCSTPCGGRPSPR